MKIIFLLLITNVVMAQKSYVAYWSTKYPRNTEADIDIRSNGDIVCYYDRFYGGATDQSGSEVYSRISYDGGRSWYDNQLTQPNIGTQNTNSVSTLRVGDSLLIFFCVKNSNTDLHVYYKKSGNEGVTWTAPRKITPGSGNGSGYWILANNRAMLLASGRIMLPICWVSDAGILGISEGYKCRSIYSDDGGQTWTSSPDVALLSMSLGWAEPAIVEISPGVLHMYARVQSGGRQYRSISTDNGQTWSAATQSTLVSPEAPVKIIKLSDGRLLAAHINNSVNQIRRPLVLSVSLDNGITWTVKQTIGNNNISWFVYPSLTERAGFIYVTYWEQITAKTVFSMVFEKISLTNLN